jgi:lipopolysaccharide transport system permease protein
VTSLRIDFLIELIRRRVMDRYVGTSSRILWVFLSPLVPLLTYVGLFYFVARIPQIQSMGLAGYALFMFSGLLPFRIIQRATTESCDLLVGNMEMLKTAVFPLSFLSLAAVGAILVDFGVQALFVAGLMVIAGVSLSWTILLLPAAVILLFALALGASWILSILSYALRDLQEIVGVLFSVLLYLTPIMYPLDAAPSALRILMWINPLSAYVTIFRDVVMPGAEGLHFLAWAIAGGTSTVSLVVGALSIRASQRFVGDMV